MANNTNQSTGGGGPQYNSLTKGTKVVGTIITDDDIRIDGTMEGNVTSKGKIIIGQQGTLKGNINCQNAEILGCTDGKIICHELLTLRQSSHITGDVITQTLIVEANAQFNGSCRMANNIVELTEKEDLDIQ